MTPQFHKGQQVNYLGSKATIAAVKTDMFGNTYYSVRYRGENNIRRMAAGVYESHGSIKKA